MYVPSDFARRLGPPAFLRETDSVLARDHSTPGENLRNKIIEHVLDFSLHIFIRVVRRHEIDVNVPVTRVTKTGNRKSMPLLQRLREFD